jgi:acetamidase/formamidase/AraC-like DNA-binding protein
LLHSTYFTTESYPSNQRLTAWRDTLERLSLQVHKHKTAPGGTVHGTVSSAVSPQGLTFASIRSGPQELSYQDANRSGAVCLTLHLEGEAILVHETRETPIVCGDIVFGPTGATGGLSLQTNFRQLLVNIPRKALRSRLPTPLSLEVGRLRGDCGIGHVFAGMLGSVADAIDDLTIDQLRPIEIALSEFLVSSLADADSTHQMVGATSTQTSNLHRISQYIEARLSEPDLSIAKVAHEVGVSTRYLQKLFETVGESFSHYVRLRRLDRCRADLINPLYAHLSISDICFRWSFNDAARFSRTFREQYNMSPRTYRTEIGEAVSKKMLQHLSRGWPGSSEQELKKLRRQELPTACGIGGDTPLHLRSSRGAQGARPAQIVHTGLHQHYLAANARSVHWGYFSRSLEPVMEVQSGDIIAIETLSHHSNDDHERMVAGDPGAESVFHWTPQGKNVERRGAGPSDASIYGRGSGEGFGVHICTGPVAVAGAEPGDVMEVRILDVMPRPSVSPQYFGRCFGSNAATWWGFHYNELLTEPKPREVVTIYEIHSDDNHEFARAVYNFRWTPQTDPYGVVHSTIDYPGVRVDHSTVVENHEVLKHIRIPVRPHFGVIALAPKEVDIVDSIPPSYFGGNIDNKRAGKGATMYLPVSVPGGLFSVGDPHASQGDAELCGTAIECSFTGVFQLILHKKADLEAKPFADLNYPLLETSDEWVVHGFSYANYLAELGDRAQSEIYKNSTLDSAMKDAFRKMRRFLMTAKNLSEDEAISLMSVAVDFGITQVVDGNWCVHGVLKKSLFHE